MLRVGLVGFGMAGRVFHGPLISSVDGVELAAVMERNSNGAETRYPGIRTYRLLEEMLKDDSLGLLVVATPSGTHFDLAGTILEAGKNVVVDKPVAVASEQIAELMALARKNKVLLMPFQNRRWDGDFLTVKKLVAEEALGRLVYVESRFDRWRPNMPTNRLWKEEPAGGGVLLDLGTHLADQALALFGKPLAISADVLREREWAKANDGFELRLRYAGFKVVLGADSLTLPAEMRFHLRGTKGNYWKNGLDPQEAALNKVTQITDAKWGQEPQKEWGSLHVDVDGGIITRPVETVAGDYRKYYEGVRDAVLGKGDVPVKVVEAFRTAQLLEWAQESSDRRCEVVCDWSGEPE
jgi:scyllo-inositol 2-dehydrogenase (NADP+)